MQRNTGARLRGPATADAPHAVIPQAAPALRIARYRREIDTAIATALGSPSYVLGPRLAEFERAFAAYVGVGHCVGVNSGTDALALALRAVGVSAGDEVITSALTHAGTAQAILHCGAVPRFVDVDPIMRCIDPAAIAAAVNARTVAIVPVHLFGHPAAMAEIMRLAGRHALAVVEDSAQAHGAGLGGRKVGTFGIAAAFSFYPTKNLGGVGDGGAIVTNDDALAARLRRLRQYGQGEDRISTGIGFNSRLDELQAAVLAVLLRHLDDGNEERRRIAAAYNERLSAAGLDLPPEAPGAVHHQYAIASDRRDRIAEGLRAQGIGTAVHYAPALHQHPAFAATPPVSLPVTETLSRRLLSLPIQPEIAGAQVDRIADAILRVLSEC